MWHYADELANEYKEGLCDLIEKRAVLEFEREAKKKELQKKRKQHQAVTPEELEEVNELNVEISIVSGMVSDMEYAIQWLETAREPGQKRGITNRSRYQRTELWAEIDILSMQAYRTQAAPGGRDLTLEEHTRMNEILSCLTAREREAYCYIMGEGHTQEQAGIYMGISRTTAETLLNRAKHKIQKKLDSRAVQTQLF